MRSSKPARRRWMPLLLRRIAGGNGPVGAWARRLIVLAIVTGVLFAGWGYAWRTWGEAGTRGEEFTVTPEKINITPPPAWIHADVKGEVVKSGGLSSLALRDPQLVDKVSRAFAVHSWVAKVKQVRKHFPARVDVELEYRRPMAMVEVLWQGEPKLYFIDAQSVLLPSEDFEKEVEQQASLFLRIDAGDIAPAGRAFGTPWGSERIAGAALVADAWQDHWKRLGLYRIRVTEDANARPMYVLATQSDTRVLWGHAPGSETKGEQNSREKIAWLEQYVAKHGPLDQSAADAKLDLRTPTGKSPPQTARKSGPTKR